jgi:hypothetical protein
MPIQHCYRRHFTKVGDVEFAGGTADDGKPPLELMSRSCIVAKIGVVPRDGGLLHYVNAN